MGCCISSDADGPINLHAVDQSHFSMMKVIGKGGFGKVNAVTHRISGRLFAMKRLKKSKVVSRKAFVVTAWRERDIMAKLSSPFLVNLEYAFQDAHDLFLIMPFMAGGDLRYYLNTKGRMTEDICRFYSAQMILGLEELHRLHIVYRDLKPDNVLFDVDGHLRISDFGLGVILTAEEDYKTTGGAGTPGYQAPEVLSKTPYGVSADVWSLGITMYELLERDRPFRSNEETLTEDRVSFDERRSPEAKDLIRRLLIKDPNKRYGCTTPAGIAEVKKHPFYSKIDWARLETRSITAPIQPDLDRANFSADYELQEQFFSEHDTTVLAEELQANFKGFEYRAEYNGPDPNILEAERKVREKMERRKGKKEKEGERARPTQTTPTPLVENNNNNNNNKNSNNNMNTNDKPSGERNQIDLQNTNNKNNNVANETERQDDTRKNVHKANHSDVPITNKHTLNTTDHHHVNHQQQPISDPNTSNNVHNSLGQGPGPIGHHTHTHSSPGPNTANNDNLPYNNSYNQINSNNPNSNNDPGASSILPQKNTLHHPSSSIPFPVNSQPVPVDSIIVSDPNDHNPLGKKGNIHSHSLAQEEIKVNGNSSANGPLTGSRVKGSGLAVEENRFISTPGTVPDTEDPNVS